MVWADNDFPRSSTALGQQAASVPLECPGGHAAKAVSGSELVEVSRSPSNHRSAPRDPRPLGQREPEPGWRETSSTRRSCTQPLAESEASAVTTSIAVASAAQPRTGPNSPAIANDWNGRRIARDSLVRQDKSLAVAKSKHATTWTAGQLSRRGWDSTRVRQRIPNEAF